MAMSLVGFVQLSSDRLCDFHY
jgi:hypothetical protein